MWAVEAIMTIWTRFSIRNNRVITKVSLVSYPPNSNNNNRISSRILDTVIADYSSNHSNNNNN